MPIFLLGHDELYSESSSGTCGRDHPVRILGEARVRIRSSRKNICHANPTGITENRRLPGEKVALFRLQPV